MFENQITFLNEKIRTVRKALNDPDTYVYDFFNEIEYQIDSY